jgi:hypothetical protein
MLDVSDLEKTYCSCNVEGRDVELTPEGIYTCCSCGLEVFIHKSWRPQNYKMRIKNDKI